jgi:hypothetical protein
MAAMHDQVANVDKTCAILYYALARRLGCSAADGHSTKSRAAIVEAQGLSRNPIDREHMLRIYA